MDISPAMRRRMTTPSGRLNEAYGAPRPVSPTQYLVPVGPFSAPSQRLIGRAVGAAPNAAQFAQVTVPKLDAPFIQPDGTINIPWYQVIVNLYRLAQPTGVVPGTYLGITFNAFGQAVAAQVSGVTIETPHLVNATANTPPANDNSDAIATTAFVHSQGYLTGNQTITLSADVSGSGATAIAATVVALQHRAVSAAAPAVGQALVWNGSQWAPGQAGIPDAPADGQRYVRQNNQWVVIVSP